MSMKHSISSNWSVYKIGTSLMFTFLKYNHHITVLLFSKLLKFVVWVPGEGSEVDDQIRSAHVQRK